MYKYVHLICVSNKIKIYNSLLLDISCALCGTKGEYILFVNYPEEMHWNTSSLDTLLLFCGLSFQKSFALGFANYYSVSFCGAGTSIRGCVSLTVEVCVGEMYNLASLHIACASLASGWTLWLLITVNYH